MWPANRIHNFHSRIADGALYFNTPNLLVNGDFETGNVVNGAPEPWRALATSSYFKNKPQGAIETAPGGVKPGKRMIRFT